MALATQERTVKTRKETAALAQTPLEVAAILVLAAPEGEASLPQDLLAALGCPEQETTMATATATTRMEIAMGSGTATLIRVMAMATATLAVGMATGLEEDFVDAEIAKLVGGQ